LQEVAVRGVQAQVLVAREAAAVRAARLAPRVRWARR